MGLKDQQQALAKLFTLDSARCKLLSKSDKFREEDDVIKDAFFSGDELSMQIFEFADSWNGTAPLVVIPTTYYSVNVDELIQHKIKMVIYANQTLRAAHLALSNLLSEMKDANNMSQVQNKMSPMDDIFKLQEMHDVKSQEKILEEKLRKLGYIS